MQVLITLSRLTESLLSCFSQRVKMGNAESEWRWWSWEGTTRIENIFRFVTIFCKILMDGLLELSVICQCVCSRISLSSCGIAKCNWFTSNFLHQVLGCMHVHSTESHQSHYHHEPRLTTTTTNHPTVVSPINVLNYSHKYSLSSVVNLIRALYLNNLAIYPSHFHNYGGGTWNC